MTTEENNTPWPTHIDGKVNVHGTTDARVWAKEFCSNEHNQVRRAEGESQEDFEYWMSIWFANAIMTGVDHANWANGHAPNCSMPWPDDKEE